MRVTDSMLYPVYNTYRTNRLLNGSWNFQFDPENKGEQEEWAIKLPNPIIMPVPGSFADLVTEKKNRDYTGNFWYQTKIFINSFQTDRKILLRFGSVTHRAKIYLNGKLAGKHEGGFLPFVVDITDLIKRDKENVLSIKVNNELSEKTLPCGTVEVLSDGRKIAKPYFDFFNYSGIMRNVWLMTIPVNSIVDYDTNFSIDANKNAKISYSVQSIKISNHVIVELIDNNGKIITKKDGAKGTFKVPQAHLWSLDDPFLYKFKILLFNENTQIDEYQSNLGIRTIKISGERVLLNNKPIEFKGFGKHEDFDVLGKAINGSIIKRDFECMKWIGANCFRTSHYPYAEEWYQYADRYGFLIIDEVPAVGLVRSTHNFIQAINGHFTRFFQQSTIPTLKKVHENEISEMIRRDKNHPSVIAWSLFNEPESTSKEAHDYFEDVFNYARELDTQNRPLTGALENHSQPDKDTLSSLCDIVALNRYYGWYVKGGAELVDAQKQFKDEMDKWQAKKLNKPFIFTEFGADTLENEHRLPSEMWSQEYQNDIYKMFFNMFKKYSFIQGGLVWNFADFKTSEGILRVGGNKKGIFTRERQPKEAAFLLKKYWKNN